MKNRDLTPEEKSKPYSKYFYQEMAKPADTKLAIAKGGPMDPSQATPIERRAEILDRGYKEVEVGYCHMADGSAYVANQTTMPGVTIDMINWWFAWHGLESLRYMLWHPKAHYAVHVDEAARKRILDPATPMTAKFQGLTHQVTEDIGSGTALLDINFMTPENFLGAEVHRFHSQGKSVTFVGGYVFVTPEGAHPNAPKLPVVMMHFIRANEGGVDYRTRFWFGYSFEQGQPKKLLPPGVNIPAEAPQGLLLHNIEEYTNLASILPTLYREMGGIIN